MIATYTRPSKIGLWPTSLAVNPSNVELSSLHIATVRGCSSWNQKRPVYLWQGFLCFPFNWYSSTRTETALSKLIEGLDTMLWGSLPRLSHVQINIPHSLRLVNKTHSFVRSPPGAFSNLSNVSFFQTFCIFWRSGIQCSLVDHRSRSFQKDDDYLPIAVTRLHNPMSLSLH